RHAAGLAMSSDRALTEKGARHRFRLVDLIILIAVVGLAAVILMPFIQRIGLTHRSGQRYVTLGHGTRKTRVYFNEAALALKKHLLEKGLATASRPPDNAWSGGVVFPKQTEEWYWDGKTPVWVAIIRANIVGQASEDLPVLGVKTHWSANGSTRYLDGIEAQAKNLQDDLARWWDDYRARHPNTSAAFLDRGYDFMKKKEYDNAILQFNEAIRVDAKCARAFRNRGLVYAERAEYDKAIADFTEAIRIDPKSDIDFGNRGLTFTKKKEYQK